MWHTIAVALLVCAGASVTQARFQQLAEVCRTTTGLGVCVQSDLCCTAVGGTVYNDTNGLIQPSSNALSRSLNVQVQQSERTGRRYSSLHARATELAAFPDALQERSVNQTSGCSYSGVCCVLPTPTDYDCSSCGLWGDGVRRKVTTPTPVQVPPTTTTNSPLGKKILPRIVGGTDAPRNRWCWQVAILDANGLVCGGSLIARNWVITAAHCVAGRFLDELIIALGLYDFVHSDADSIVYYHTPVGAILYTGYNPATYDGDLALIRIPDAPCGQPGVCTICLGPPLTFEPPTTTPPPTTSSSTTTDASSSTYTYGAAFVNPLQPTFDPKATLAKIQSQITSAGGSLVVADNGSVISVGTANPYANLVCAITGFGSTGVTPVAPVLQQAYQQIITPDQCESDFERLGVPTEKINLPANTICSRGLTLTESSCVGDGGGPLACQSHADHGWYLYGVIGLGSNMCMPGAENGPTISAAVGSYLAWILATVHDLPSTDTGSGRNAYKVPGCGSQILANNPNATDPALGGCPINVHAQQAAALRSASAVQRRSIIATGGELYDFQSV